MKRIQCLVVEFEKLDEFDELNKFEVFDFGIVGIGGWFADPEKPRQSTSQIIFKALDKGS
jgi:hypothetical protein